MTQIELVQQALRKEASVEEIGALLRQLPPDKETADLLIATYQAGLADPWKVASLLGCVRHEVGYETVKAILVGVHRKESERYAGEAMVLIRGDRAIGDLRNILLTHPHVVVRNGAAFGLAQFRSPEVISYFVQAFREGKLWPKDVAEHITRCQPRDSQLLSLLQSQSEQDQTLGMHVVDAMSILDEPTGRPSEQVRKEVARLLETPLFRPKRKQMRRLYLWASSPSA